MAFVVSVLRRCSIVIVAPIIFGGGGVCQSLMSLFGRTSENIHRELLSIINPAVYLLRNFLWVE